MPSNRFETPTCIALALALLVMPLATSSPTRAEDDAHALRTMTLRQVTEQLFKATPGTRLDFSTTNLEKLDLSDLDFKGAILKGANLYGADLSRAKLAAADLEGARLDRALLTSTDFSGANLANARILRPTIFTSLEVVTQEAPRFTGANLAGAEINGWLDRTDFRAANLEGTVFGARTSREDSQLAARISLISANFTEARMREVKLAGADLHYARFINADLKGANFRGADLTQADFTGADLTGADVTGANVDEANFRQAKGVETLIGLADAVNADRALVAGAP